MIKLKKILNEETKIVKEELLKEWDEHPPKKPIVAGDFKNMISKIFYNSKIRKKKETIIGLMDWYLINKLYNSEKEYHDKGGFSDRDNAMEKAIKIFEKNLVMELDKIKKRK